jgi:hypothetical protein
MFTRILLGLVVLFPLAMQSDMKITPLNVKTGLWETSMTMTGLPAMPAIPDSALAQMTPEQRARVQAMMGGKPITAKTCITKEKLEKSTGFEKLPKSCTYTIVSSTSSKIEMKMECSQNGMTMTGDYDAEAIDSENIKGSMHMNASNPSGSNNAAGGNNTPAGAGAMNMNSTFTSKWVAAACGDVQ